MNGLDNADLKGWHFAGFDFSVVSRFIACALAILFFLPLKPACARQILAGSPSSGSVVELQDKLELLMDRRASLRRLGEPRFMDLKFIGVGANDIVAASALLGCGKAEWQTFMVNLPNMETGDKPTEMFSLVPLVRYLYQFGSCLTEVQKKQILTKLNKPQYLFGHGTTNMAIVQASSWYLLAQYFPNNTWQEIESHQSYTSAQVMAKLKPLLASRTMRTFHSGHLEWLSPSYALMNLYPLFNLIDFAVDKVVRNNANDEAILEIAVLKTNSFHGVIVPPFARNTADQRNALDEPINYAPAASQLALWYYFGEPAGLGQYDLRSHTGSFYVSMLGISPWLPPSEILAMKLPAAATVDQAVKTITPGFTIWGNPVKPLIFGDSWISEDFSVGTGNQLFDPYEYSGHVQTFSILLKSTKPHNEIECYQPFWHSASGEDAWQSDRSSPFQQMYRYDESSVVMLFDIPETDPWKSDASNRFWPERSSHADALLRLVTCRFARNFDEIIQQPNWVFVREGNAFAAMATLKGSNEYNNASPALLHHFTMVKIHEPKTALFFRVDKQRADLNFAQFQTAVRKSVPTYDAARSSIAVNEKNGSKTNVIFELKKQADSNYWSALPNVIKDGQPMKYNAAYTVQAPGLTLRDGVLTIKTEAGELKLVH
ncbi:putative RNA binding protein with dsRBD fold (UPF0201 family) [Oxalobacteraceae bacterium GrIS 2.11]